MSRPIALVTGASAGIGWEFAQQLAARGYDIIATARRRDRLDELGVAIRSAHPQATVHVVTTDLADATGLEHIARDVSGRELAVDLLVNNAGFGTHGRFAQIDAGRESDEITVNVCALVALTHAFLPGMLARKRGAVINVASTAAFQPVPYMAVYGATKAFVLSFSQALDEEVRREGVRVIALCPGQTTTEFFEIAGTGARVGTPRTVGDVVRTGLRALDRGQAVAIDGAGNAALANVTRFLPRGLVTNIGARLLAPKT